MRRKKSEVAPELPDKIEQILHVQLSEEQKKIYQEVRISSESELDKLAQSGATEGANENENTYSTAPTPPNML